MQCLAGGRVNDGSRLHSCGHSLSRGALPRLLTSLRQPSPATDLTRSAFSRSEFSEGRSSTNATNASDATNRKPRPFVPWVALNVTQCVSSAKVTCLSKSYARMFGRQALSTGQLGGVKMCDSYGLSTLSTVNHSAINCCQV